MKNARLDALVIEPGSGYPPLARPSRRRCDELRQCTCGRPSRRRMRRPVCELADCDQEPVSSFCPSVDPLLILGNAPLGIEPSIVGDEHSWSHLTAQQNNFLLMALHHPVRVLALSEILHMIHREL